MFVYIGRFDTRFIGRDEMSAKKLSAKEIFNRTVRPIRVDNGKKKEKSVSAEQGKRKDKEKEEVIDDRLEIAASSLHVLSAGYLEKLDVLKGKK